MSNEKLRSELSIAKASGDARFNSVVPIKRMLQYRQLMKIVTAESPQDAMGALKGYLDSGGDEVDIFTIATTVRLSELLLAAEKAEREAGHREDDDCSGEEAGLGPSGLPIGVSRGFLDLRRGLRNRKPGEDLHFRDLTRTEPGSLTQQRGM